MKILIVLVLAVFLLTACSSIDESKQEFDRYIPEGAVVVDYSQKIGIATPYVFGMVKNDDNETSKLIQIELDNIGITWIRKSFWFELMLPESIVPDIQYWEHNVNDCKNVIYWQSNHLDALLDAKKSNCKVMMIVCYTPPFLAYNGNWNGVPKDWDIYEEIVRIAVEKYKNYIDFYEIWNEYSYEYLDITGSPYANDQEAYQDIYIHSAKAIREIVPDAIIGGPATAMGGNTDELESLLDNPAFSPESNLLNFVSFHEYTNGDITKDVEKYRKILDSKGYRDIPIYINEWGSSMRGEFYANRYGISFIGRTLISFMKKNVGAAYYNANYINGAVTDDFGICDYNPIERKVYVKPIVNAFKIAGVRLGLSKGGYELMETEAGDTTDSLGIINSIGQKVVYMVNDTSVDVTVPVVLKNIDYNGEPVCKAYTASSIDDGNFGAVLVCEYYKNVITTSITIPAYGVVGVVVDDDFEYVPENEKIDISDSLIINPGFENGYYGWTCSGRLSDDEVYSGDYCTIVLAGCSSEQIVQGLKPDSKYLLSAYVKTKNGGIGCLGAKDMGTEEIGVNYEGTEYKKINIIFTTGIDSTSAKIFIFNPSSIGVVYADDFNIELVD